MKSQQQRYPYVRQIMRRALFRLVFFVTVSYGFLYFSYKYYTPDFGGTDFYTYYQMYLHPLNFSVAEPPHIFRQLTAIIVHVIWKLGIFYDTTAAFSRAD